MHPYLERLLLRRTWTVVGHHVTQEDVRTVTGETATDFFVMQDETGDSVFMSRGEVERFASTSCGMSALLDFLPKGQVPTGDKMPTTTPEGPATRRDALVAGLRLPQVSRLEAFVGRNKRLVDPDWDVSHLGRAYFQRIFDLCRDNGFWPIRFVWTGRTGTPYVYARRNLSTGPNWMIEDMRGERRTNRGGFHRRDSYKEQHMFRWDFAQVCLLVGAV